ncbi:MAG TPA: permease-like cell division protein FtsX [Actinomycetota bacterium]|nr:permease-like cell division protein FtsX [Actinomycetota bacterium]
MQSDDLKRMLAEAAADPSRPLDAGAVVRRGRRQRRTRAAAAATGLAVVLAGASASLGTLGRDTDSGPGPAAAESADPCRLGPAVHVVVFLEDHASTVDVDALGHELEADPGVVEVRYVSPEEGYEELTERLGDHPNAEPVASVPATFRVETVDESATRRIEQISGPAIERVRTSLDARRIACHEPILAAPRGESDYPTFGDGHGTEVRLLSLACGASPIRVRGDVIQTPADWCGVEMDVTNGRRHSIRFEAREQRLTDSDGHVYLPWLRAIRAAGSPSRLLDVEIAPGARRKGTIFYEVAPGAHPETLFLVPTRTRPVVVRFNRRGCGGLMRDARGDFACSYAPRT